MQSSSEMPKPGRNDPCPCGSGKKFKLCHGSVAGVRLTQVDPHVADLFVKRGAAQERQREKQQGLGKPIASFRPEIAGS
jgi:SEC-C motif